MSKKIHFFLKKTALKVGKIIIEYKKNKKIKILEKKHNLKTNIDLVANKIWKEEINKKFRNFKIISEEMEIENKINKNWEGFIIDPIDGTKSLTENFNGYVTQAAYVKNLNILSSIIFNPETNEFFNEKQKFIKTNSLNAIIDNYPEPNKINLKLINHFKIPNYIECGGIGYKMCKVLDGTSDLMIKLNKLKIWDVAPSMHIIKKNNGYVLDKNFKKIQLKNIHVNGLIVVMSKKILKILKKKFPSGLKV